MRARLLHADRDPDWSAELPPHAPDLVRDLGLDDLLDAMADGDPFLRDTARRVLLAPLTDPAAVRYRQQVLRDCLAQPAVVRELYDLAVGAIEAERRIWPGVERSPGSVLGRSVTALEQHTGRLRTLRRICDRSGSRFASPGFTGFFRMVADELDEEWFRLVRGHLERLGFKGGVLVSAELGEGCRGTGYVLREPRRRAGWRERITGGGPPSHTYRIADGDEAAARALGELRDRGIGPAAEALSRSAEHILGFWTALRRELGFYLGCRNARLRLAAAGGPLCFPDPAPPGRPVLACRGLYDAGLALRTGGPVVGNDLDAAATALIVVTGANQGGKSTFLRSVGLAQLMAQAGAEVAAESFACDLRDGLFTHFRREEDAGMDSGKLDEELARLSAVADRLTPGSMVMFNESFASTNEREGSQIAQQVIRALLDSGVKVLVVTHQYDLASALRRRPGTLCLRAQRNADGTRPFRLAPGEPLATGFGDDLYRKVFGAEPAEPGLR